MVTTSAWVLIAVWYLSSGMQLHTQEFTSEASCKAASELINKQMSALAVQKTVSNCVPK